MSSESYKKKLKLSNNSNKKLCSVLITCYQREKYIEASVESVFNQTYRPIECIVIDDGSTDNSLLVLKKLEIRFLKEEGFDFKVISTENKGACAARNLGFSISKGCFIQNLDSDDLLHPRKLEIQIKALNEDDRYKSAWNPLQRFEDGEEDGIFKVLKDSKFKTIEKVRDNPFIPQFMASAALHRRCVFAKVGLWTESLKRWQDLEYQVRMMNVIDHYLKFDRPLYFFRQHDHGRINDMFKEKKGINYGFHSLESVQKYLSPFQKKQDTIKKTMRDMYLSLFNTALVNSLKKESIMSLEYALKWSGSKAFSIKANFLITLMKLSSIKFSQFILLKTEYFF